MKPERTIQPETKRRFGENVDCLALRDNLSAFSVSGNRSGNCAGYHSATHKLTCALIASDAIAPIL
jgi:hypothetical protein